MKILALDLSLNSTGWCIMDSSVEEHESGIIKPKKTDRMEKLIEIRSFIYKLIEQHDIKCVFIEDYAFGARGVWIYSYGELCGLIKVAIVELGIKYYTVSPSLWKKFVLGKGNLPKDQVMLQIYKKYGIEFSDNNMADAFAIAKFGKALLDYQQGNKNYNKYELEAFKKMVKDAL